MTFMLSAQKAPPPGAQAVTGLRLRARGARRIAFVALSGSIALLTAAELLAERAPSRSESLPLAVLSLGLFLGALPVLAVTQWVWGARSRAVRSRERELYAGARGARRRPPTRLAVAAGWSVTLLLGFTVPRLFAEAGADGTARLLGGAAALLTLPCYAAGGLFLLWWGRDAYGALASTPSPDPWDPGDGRRGRRSPLLWSCVVAALLLLLAGRAHLWEPPVPLIYALLAAALVPALVTDE